MWNSSLPEDLAFDILSRLPVKSLLRFKSVCRSWRSMITGRRFVSEHLKRSSMNDSSAGVHHLVIAKHTETVGERYRIALLSSTLEVQSEVEAPGMIVSRQFAIAGSCRGIVCLVSNYGRQLLWNPATRESRAVPYSVGSGYSHNHYGFGYSSKLDDYKLVKIHKGRDDRLLAEVFSLREDSWRKVQPPDYFPDFYHIAGTFVNGTVNWIDGGFRDDPRPILSLDLEKDEFKLISLPPGFEGGHSCRKLAALESALLFSALSWGNEGLDLWMTNPQATHPIWTRLTTVDRLVPYCLPWPLGVGKRGEIYITNYFGGFKPSAYKPSTGKWKALHSIAGTPRDVILHPYVESLLPLHGQ